MGYLYQQAKASRRRSFQISEELRAAFRCDPPVRSSVVLKEDNESEQPSHQSVYTVHGSMGHWAIKGSSAR